jgi:uncharacterized protein (UPF0332 family)
LLDPSLFLKQANELARPATGRRQQVDLRRAISNAYYSVFHAVLGGAADLIVGRSKRETAIYSLVYRSVDHKPLRSLCDELSKQNVSSKYSAFLPNVKPSDELRPLSGAVVLLYNRRIQADYDPQFRVVRSDAISAIRAAEGALENLSAISTAERYAFFYLTVVKPRQGS